MEKAKKLYPLKFAPIQISHPWGNETIVLADLGAEDSVVTDGWLADNSIGDIMETYMERVTGEDIYNYYGRQFPIVIKILDIKGEMPFRVHPDDETAEQRYDSLGGKELWYVTEAEAGARIYAGFSRDMSARELYERCSNGTLKEVMNAVQPAAGGYIAIEPGTVHSAGNGLRIVVVKEASELPFTLYDSAGDEDCSGHLAETMDFITYGKSPVPETICGAPDILEESREGTAARIMESPEFNSGLIRLSAPLHSHAESASDCMLYMCLEGEASLQTTATDEGGRKRTESLSLKKGETVMIPSEVQDFFLIPADRDTVLLEVTPGRRDETDEYINPDTEPFLEGEDYEGLEDETDDPEADDAVKMQGNRTPGRHDMNWK